MFKILIWCNFEPIGVFDEILCGYDDIRDDIDSLLFSPVVSTVSKLRMFKLLRRVHLLNQLVDLDEILYIVVMALKLTSVIPKWLSVPH
jgi:hypothetical protein